MITNEKVLKKALALGPMHAVHIRERLIVILELSLKDMEEASEKWENTIFHPDYLKKTYQEILNIVSFNN
jgi:hypothetical protein